MLARSLLFELLGERTNVTSKSWLVDGLLGAGDLAILSGPPGVSKSVLALDLACCVSAGAPWLGRGVARGSVLFLALERSDLTRRRYIGWREAYDGPAPEVALASGPVTLMTERAADEVSVAIEEVGRLTGQPPRLLIIDTLAHALDGDENSVRDVMALVRTVQHVQRRTGVAALLLHHPGRNGQARALRGSSALEGAADVVLSLSASKDNLRILEVVKANDAELSQTAYRLELRTVEIAGVAETLPVVAPAERPISTSAQLSKTESAVRDLLQEMGGDRLPVPRAALIKRCVETLPSTASEPKRAFGAILSKLNSKGVVFVSGEGVSL